MTRREWLAVAAAWTASATAGRGQHAGARHGQAVAAPDAFEGPADVTLRIGQLNLEIAPGRTVRTIAYNGQVPGPLLRAPAGRPDGRQQKSVGMTLAEFGELMLSLGIFQGMNFDGGGSTTLVVKGSIVNSPSEPTGERPVGNCLLLVSRIQ